MTTTRRSSICRRRWSPWRRTLRKRRSRSTRPGSINIFPFFSSAHRDSLRAFGLVTGDARLTTLFGAWSLCHLSFHWGSSETTSKFITRKENRIRMYNNNTSFLNYQAQKKAKSRDKMRRNAQSNSVLSSIHVSPRLVTSHRKVCRWVVGLQELLHEVNGEGGYLEHK